MDAPDQARRQQVAQLAKDVFHIRAEERAVERAAEENRLRRKRSEVRILSGVPHNRFRFVGVVPRVRSERNSSIGECAQSYPHGVTGASVGKVGFA